MARPSFTVRSFDGRAFSLRPGSGECSEVPGRFPLGREVDSSGVRGPEFLDCQRKRRLELLLRLLVELGAADREIEDVDGDLSLGIDQGHLDIAIVRGQRSGDLAQQPWAILGDHLQQSAVGGSRVIKFQPGRTLTMMGARTAWRRRSSTSIGVFSEITSSRLSRKRSTSEGLSSSVRKGSEN